jgi:hypothetical protein
MALNSTGEHAHTGAYQSFGVSVKSGGYDLLRPFSENNYATQGSGSNAGHNGASPRVSNADGSHSHSGTVSTYTGSTGNAGSATPAGVSIVQKYLALRFLIKT